MADPESPNTGGIALIGWSLGGIHVLALLAYLDALPGNTQSILQKYLHTILCHGEVVVCLITQVLRTHMRFLSDASAIALGIPNTPKHSISLWSETDVRKRFDAFFDWASAHYIHKSVMSENLDDLEFNNPSSDIPHSFDALSYTQRAEYTDIKAFSPDGCDGKLLFCDTTAFAVLTRRALFDKACAEKSPNVRVRFMSGGTSAGALVWALWMLREYVDNPPKVLYGRNAEKARDIQFITHTEGNHFIFWEDPEKAIQQFTAAISL